VSADGRGLEVRRLAGGCTRRVLGPAAQDGSPGGIKAEALGVVDVFTTGRTTGEGLREEGWPAVLGVPPLADVVQGAGGRAGQSESVVEVTIGEVSGGTGDGEAVQLPLDPAVEIDSKVSY
jgi:hypothetical protein